MSNDIVRIATPMPVRPGSVNAYLVPLDEGGCLLVDGGIASDDAWRALDAGVRAHIPWSDVRLHVATHMHQDHVGLNRRVRDASGAPLAMGELDAERMQHAGMYPAEEADYRAELLRRSGVPEEIARVSAAPSPPPDPGTFIGADLRIGCTTDAEELPFAPEWSALWTPGHTAGHIALHRARDNLLIVGDVVIADIEPTIGVNRQRNSPVDDQLDTLDRILRLAPNRLLTGHGEALSGTDRIISSRDALIGSGERTLDCVREGETAWEINVRVHASRQLRARGLIHELRGTIAHLQRLRRLGAVRMIESDGVPRFWKCA